MRKAPSGLPGTLFQKVVAQTGLSSRASRKIGTMPSSAKSAESGATNSDLNRGLVRDRRSIRAKVSGMSSACNASSNWSAPTKRFRLSSEEANSRSSTNRSVFPASRNSAARTESASEARGSFDQASRASSTPRSATFKESCPSLSSTSRKARDTSACQKPFQLTGPGAIFAAAMPCSRTIGAATSAAMERNALASRIRMMRPAVHPTLSRGRSHSRSRSPRHSHKVDCASPAWSRLHQ